MSMNLPSETRMVNWSKEDATYECKSGKTRGWNLYFALR